MSNQLFIGKVDRRKIMRILVDKIPLTEVIDMSPAEVTDEVIAGEIHPKQKLDIGLFFGRPMHITEEEKTLDLRRYLEFVGQHKDRVMREIGKAVRALTGNTLV